jgi:hypothetical protein
MPSPPELLPYNAQLNSPLLVDNQQGTADRNMVHLISCSIPPGSHAARRIDSIPLLVEISMHVRGSGKSSVRMGILPIA